MTPSGGYRAPAQRGGWQIHGLSRSSKTCQRHFHFPGGMTIQRPLVVLEANALSSKSSSSDWQPAQRQGQGPAAPCSPGPDLESLREKLLHCPAACPNPPHILRGGFIHSAPLCTLVSRRGCCSGADIWVKRGSCSPPLPPWKEGLIPKPPAWPAGLLREKGSTASPLSHSTRPHNSRAVPMLPWHGTWGCQKYLFLVQAVKQGFLLHPKANVHQGTMLPRAECSQAGWEAAETLAGETKRNNSEASFSSPTQHNGEQRRARRDSSPREHWEILVMEAVSCFLRCRLSRAHCKEARSNHTLPWKPAASCSLSQKQDALGSAG